MSKYVVETYYTCSFKVKHYLDKIDNDEIANLEKREDGKYEILDIKLDTRKTKNLNTNNRNLDKNELLIDNQKIEESQNFVVEKKNNPENQNLTKNNKIKDKNNPRFSMPDRRKGYI